MVSRKGSCCRLSLSLSLSPFPFSRRRSLVNTFTYTFRLLAVDGVEGRYSGFTCALTWAQSLLRQRRKAVFCFYLREIPFAHTSFSFIFRKRARRRRHPSFRHAKGISPPLVAPRYKKKKEAHNSSSSNRKSFFERCLLLLFRVLQPVFFSVSVCFSVMHA